jgi:hypothetical protein
MSIDKDLGCFEKSFDKHDVIYGHIIFREWLDSNEDGVKPSIIGTTAEIFEYFEPSPESLEVGLKIKAKGRQRFKVINSHSQIDG